MCGFPARVAGSLDYVGHGCGAPPSSPRSVVVPAPLLHVGQDVPAADRERVQDLAVPVRDLEARNAPDHGRHEDVALLPETPCQFGAAIGADQVSLPCSRPVSRMRLLPSGRMRATFQNGRLRLNDACRVRARQVGCGLF